MADRKAKLAVGSLLLDFNLYPRAEIDKYHVRELQAALEAGVTLPPLLVDTKSKRVVDGFHRVKAFLRLYGVTAKIECVLRDYLAENDMLRDAMALNSAHGRALSRYDKAHAIQLADGLGLSREDTAKALSMTVERVESLLLERTTASGEVLKRTMAHFAGDTLLPEQAAYNRGAGGMDQLFYIRQVIALVESNSIDWERHTVVSALRRLSEALEKALSVAAKAD